MLTNRDMPVKQIVFKLFAALITTTTGYHPPQHSYGWKETQARPWSLFKC